MNRLVRSTLLLAAVLFSSGVSASVRIDCTRAIDGEVTIVATGERIGLIRAAKKAYHCFERANVPLLERIEAAVAKADRAVDRTGSRGGDCHPSGLVGVTTRSWMAGRPNRSGATSGSANVMILRSIGCGPVGSDRFSGTVGEVFSLVEIDETFRNARASDPSLQRLKLKLGKIVFSTE